MTVADSAATMREGADSCERGFDLGAFVRVCARCLPGRRGVCSPRVAWKAGVSEARRLCRVFVCGVWRFWEIVWKVLPGVRVPGRRVGVSGGGSGG